MNKRDSEGRRHGLWEYWDNSTLRWRENYHHGVQKGLETWCDRQGGCTRKQYHLVIR